MEKDIELMIKKQFSEKFKLSNITQRTPMEVFKIIQLCRKCDKIMVYMFRNKLNRIFFELYGELDYYDLLIFHKDDYYIYSTKLIENELIHLRRLLVDDKDCVICYNECNFKDPHCSKCGTMMCMTCAMKMKECPVCHNNKTYTNMPLTEYMMQYSKFVSV